MIALCNKLLSSAFIEHWLLFLSIWFLSLAFSIVCRNPAVGAPLVKMSKRGGKKLLSHIAITHNAAVFSTQKDFFNLLYSITKKKKTQSWFLHNSNYNIPIWVHTRQGCWSNSYGNLLADMVKKKKSRPFLVGNKIYNLEFYLIYNCSSRNYHYCALVVAQTNANYKENFSSSS